MKISGSGRIPAGEYNEKVSISGSGRVEGNLRCQSFSCSGSARGMGNIWCSEEFHASGSCRVEGDVTAAAVSASGSLHIDGAIETTGKVSVSGAATCGNLQANELRASGALRVDTDISAETVRIAGKITCGGLLNAETVDISLDQSNAESTIGSIGGSEIRVYHHGSKKVRLNLFSKLLGKSAGLTVKELIEGDLVALENVSAPKVVGRVVAIGEGCNIDLVQYSEEVEVHPKAIVGKCEKI